MSLAVVVRTGKASSKLLSDTELDVPDSTVEGSLIAVSSAENELVVVKKALCVVNVALDETQNKLQAAETKTVNPYGTIRVEWRKFQRTIPRKSKLEEQIALLQSVDLHGAKDNAAQAIQLFENSQSENVDLNNKLSWLMEKCAKEASQSKMTHLGLKAKLAESKQKCSNLQKQVDQAPEILTKAVKKAKASTSPGLSLAKLSLSHH